MGKLSRLIGLAAGALEMNSGSSGTRSADGGRALPSSPSPTGASTPPPAPGTPTRPPSAEADRAAIARYDYLMQTADPQRIDLIHRDAFARLTPVQRDLIAERMRSELPAGERPRSASADDLGRAAGRAEAVRPGRMRGLLSRVRGGRSGGMVIGAGGAAVGVLGAVAGGAVLSAVAVPILEQASALGVDFASLAEGVDLESLTGALDVEALTGGAEDMLGSAGDAVSGIGETAAGWGERLGDVGLPGIGDCFGR